MRRCGVKSRRTGVVPMFMPVIVSGARLCHDTAVARKIFLCGGLWMTLLLAGCQWVGFNNNVTPQVCGRVLDAKTRQPLPNVKVLRVMHGQGQNSTTPVNGAQLLQQERPVKTDAGGGFIYPSHSYMTLLSQARWWSLKLSFRAAGYSAVQTNFTLVNVNTNLPDGTPVVDAGEILLEPLPK